MGQRPEIFSCAGRCREEPEFVRTVQCDVQLPPSHGILFLSSPRRAFLVDRRRTVWQPCYSRLCCHESAKRDCWIRVNCPVRCAASAIASHTFPFHCHEARGSFSRKSSTIGMTGLYSWSAPPESSELDLH